MTDINSEEVFSLATDLVLGCEALHAGACSNGEHGLSDFDGISFFDDYSGVRRSFFFLELLEDFISRVNDR